MSDNIQNILIVGGGTAGWMTACNLSKRLPNMDITLTESSDVPTVDVGQGTIIRMAGLLSDMGLGVKRLDIDTCLDACFSAGVERPEIRQFC